MPDTFNEHMVKKIPDLKTVLLRSAIIGGAFILLNIAFLVPAIVPYFIPLAIGIIYSAWLLITMMNIEYEYIVTNGEMDVDKIINRRKRKRVITVNCKDFELLARCSTHQQEQAAQFAKTYDFSSSVKSERRWFFVTNTKDGRTMVIFEPTDRIIEAFRGYIPRKVFD